MNQTQIKPAVERDTETETDVHPSSLVRLLASRAPNYRLIVILGIVLLALLVTGAMVYFFWYLWIPKLSAWGFSPVSWRALIAVFAIFFLAILPMMPAVWAAIPIGQIFETYTEDEIEIRSKKTDALEQQTLAYEAKISENDPDNLLALVKFSKVELRQYYENNIRRTMKTFRYAVLAMWIGFVIIAAGLVFTLVPSEYLPREANESNVQTLTLAGGVVVEVISALFFWMYSRTQVAERFFFDRQAFLYSALIANKIASGIDDRGKAQAKVVEKILEFGAMQGEALPKVPAKKKDVEAKG